MPARVPFRFHLWTLLPNSPPPTLLLPKSINNLRLHSSTQGQVLSRLLFRMIRGIANLTLLLTKHSPYCSPNVSQHPLQCLALANGLREEIRCAISGLKHVRASIDVAKPGSLSHHLKEAALSTTYFTADLVRVRNRGLCTGTLQRFQSPEPYSDFITTLSQKNVSFLTLKSCPLLGPFLRTPEGWALIATECQGFRALNASFPFHSTYLLRPILRHSSAHSCRASQPEFRCVSSLSQPLYSFPMTLPESSS